MQILPPGLMYRPSGKSQGVCACRFFTCVFLWSFFVFTLTIFFSPQEEFVQLRKFQMHSEVNYCFHSFVNGYYYKGAFANKLAELIF